MDHLDRLNQKLRNRERIFGYTIYLPNTYMQMEYMPQGVDYVLFDCEHGPHDEDSYAAYYRHFRALGIPTITRIADAEYHLAARAMDCGSDGLLIPRVETMEQVRAAVDGIFLPPIGKKGCGGRYMRYPGETLEEYNRRRILWIQIESPEGAAILLEILEAYGHLISACVIGPCDLSIRAGTPLDIYSEPSRKVLDQVHKTCLRYGISSGSYSGSLQEAAFRVSLGNNLVWMSCDTVFMADGIQRAAAAIAAL